jgi:putative two-component system response regulator
MAESERRGGAGALLIVDDEPLVRNVLSDLLSESYECVTAASAEAALEQVSSGRFKVVLSDIEMGGMTGLEMLPRVKRASPETAVVMISGVANIEAAIGAMRAGAFDFVRKPFDLDQIELAVGRAATHHDLVVAKRRYENELERMVESRTAELGRAVGSLEGAYRATLRALTAALDIRDAETAGHSERVVGFSLRLARELGLSAEELRSLEYGALLHDIGKIGVPDSVLRKPSKLDDAEWGQMRLHPLHGQQMLRGIEFLEGASRVVAEHHEKWDGSGYPRGLRGEEIDLKARVFMVADAFDAMVSDRVYRPGRSHEAACAELARCAGSHFDPEVVDAFLGVPAREWDAIRAETGPRREETLAA